MIKKIVLVSMLIFLTGCVTQQEYLSIKYQKGKMYFSQKQYRNAFESLYPVAKAGNPEAQYAIGYMYYYGQGIIENKQLAEYWMTESAKQNNVSAQKALAKFKQNNQSLYSNKKS